MRRPVDVYGWWRRNAAIRLDWQNNPFLNRFCTLLLKEFPWRSIWGPKMPHNVSFWYWFWMKLSTMYSCYNVKLSEIFHFLRSEKGAPFKGEGHRESPSNPTGNSNWTYPIATNLSPARRKSTSEGQWVPLTSNLVGACFLAVIWRGGLEFKYQAKMQIAP